MDDTNLDFPEDLFPWSEKLPEDAKSGLPRCNSPTSSDADLVEIWKTKNEEFPQEVPRFRLLLFLKTRVV